MSGLFECMIGGIAGEAAVRTFYALFTRVYDARRRDTAR